MQFTMADVKPSVLSFLIVGLMAVIFISLGKFITSKYDIPGLTQLFQAV
jgi:hypothetical protein